MSSRLPVMEASKLRTMVKVIQIFLALTVIVSIRYFKSNTSIKVLCDPEMSTSWTASDHSRNSTITALLSGVEELNSSAVSAGSETMRPGSETFLNSSAVKPGSEKFLNSSAVKPSSETVRPGSEKFLNSSAVKPGSETVRPSFETFLNYTIQFPFKSPKVLEPLNCNETSRVYARAVHPSMRVPAMVLIVTATVSSMYCFIYVYAYSDFDSFSRPQILSEIITSILLTFFWFLSSVSWSSSVAHIKHFGTHFIYYSHLCDDPMARCTKTVSGSSYCSLYLSLIFCFFNFLTWFILTCLRIHSSAFLLFPTYFTSTAQAKFSRVKSFHSLNNSQTLNSQTLSSQTLNSQTLNTSQSIATIEDKIEFQRDDFFHSLKEPKSHQFRTAGGSINNPNYDPHDSANYDPDDSANYDPDDSANYDPDDFVNTDGKH